MRRVIVAGSSKHHISKIGYGWLDAYLDLDGIDILVCGMAPCVDSDSRRWALSKKIKIEEFPAEWQNFDLPIVKIKYKGDYKYNAAAGIWRNEIMAQNATDVILFPGRNGTDSMFKLAKKYKLKITDWREYHDLLIKYEKRP